MRHAKNLHFYAALALLKQPFSKTQKFCAFNGNCKSAITDLKLI
uniref:Orphan protein n=1 Tax=Ascaris lumbricoides TaxID=6252 RepID=A0A0M3IUQ8_ASCLU